MRGGAFYSSPSASNLEDRRTNTIKRSNINHISTAHISVTHNLGLIFWVFNGFIVHLISRRSFTSPGQWTRCCGCTYSIFNSKVWRMSRIHFNHAEELQGKRNKKGGRVHICDSASLTADERKSFEVDVVLFLRWLRLNTNAHSERRIHHFNDTFSGRSHAQAEINSTLVPCVCAHKDNPLIHTHIYVHEHNNAQFCLYTKKCRLCVTANLNSRNIGLWFF